MKTILKVLAVVILTLGISTQTAFAQNPNIELSALDTVANFETIVKVKALPALEDVSLKITKPDNSSFEIAITADDSGDGSAIVPDTHTRLAGQYKVLLVKYGLQTEFTVFPGDTNPNSSGVYTDKNSIEANGLEKARVTVRITDDFGNPLEGHDITIVSSKHADYIAAESNETDEKGLAVFLISSEQIGTSILTATDETAQVTLAARPKISFSEPKVSKSIGGDPELLLLAQASQTVAKLEIDNMPASANINDALSLRVKAVDAAGNLVPTYNKTIHFSSPTDLNAVLPHDYTFTAADQGQKTFSGGVSFRNAGDQKIVIQEVGNSIVKGEKIIRILLSQNTQGGQVSITRPATGTYTVKTLEVAGQADPNSQVKIFDNGQQIAEVRADNSGRFSYNTSLLTDGQHTFHAESNGVQSMPVSVEIDSTPAQVQNAEISKKTLAPGETTEISIRSDPDLTSIQATVGNTITDLEQDPQNPGLYRGTITAPMEEGRYTVNIIITDKNGNPSPETEIDTITVNSDLAPPAPVSFNVPSRVDGVSVSPGRNAVNLVWQPAQAVSGISHYRIYYGTDPNNINLVLNTPDSRPGARITNLQNGTPYYFQVVGVDTQNNEGDIPSAVVNSTPSATAADNYPALCDGGPCPPDIPYPPGMPQDGPGVFGAVITAILGGGLIRKFWRKK